MESYSGNFSPAKRHTRVLTTWPLLMGSPWTNWISTCPQPAPRTGGVSWKVGQKYYYNSIIISSLLSHRLLAVWQSWAPQLPNNHRPAWWDRSFQSSKHSWRVSSNAKRLEARDRRQDGGDSGERIREFDIFIIWALSSDRAPVLQELHNLEVNLVETQRVQRLQEQRLQQREAELAERELTLLQRELHVMMAQQQPSQAIPTPKKRKGKFKKKMLLKKESSSSSMISGPSGLCLSAALMTQNWPENNQTARILLLLIFWYCRFST